jgi:beta-1,4-mannosyltransferase
MSGLVSPAAVGVNASVPSWLRIASYPERNPGNPYIELLYQALAQHGVAHAGRLVPDANWFDGAGRDVDAVHIHWPERIWRGKRVGRLDRALAVLTARSARGVHRFCRFLDEAHRRGVIRVWTAHNLAHHEGTSLVDRWAYRELIRRVDLVLCFSRAAEMALRAQYGTDLPIVVTSHGSYKGAYPASPTRPRARERLGLRQDVPVLSCLGLLRPYKGVELACAAVEALAGRAQLLVAGQAQRTFDVEGLRARARRSNGAISVIPRALTDVEFSDAVAASDAVLLPYHSVTGSGVLFAAWTLGAGVIASDLPFFREMLDGRPALGRTFAAGDSAALAAAIEAYLAIPVQDRRRTIAAEVDALSPERVVIPFVNALRDAHAQAGPAITAART